MLDASLPALFGQVLWLDAADATTIRDTDGDSAATGTGGANNGFSGNVATWVDKSGSGFNVTSAVAAEQPLYGAVSQNGKNLITLDGTNDRLFNSSAAVAGDDFTAFVVFNRTTAAGRDAVFEIGSGASRNGLYVGNVVGKESYFLNSTFYDFSGGYTAGTFTITSLMQDITAITAYKDGVGQVSATGAVRAGTTGLYIGDDSTSGDQLQGNIAEMIVYNRDLTTEEIHDVENYLATKWGLSVANTAPYVDVNNPLTLPQGTGIVVSSLYLGATDTDNTDTSLIFTITDLPDYGSLTNTNTGMTLGVGSTFTQSDISSNYIYYTNNGTPNFADAFLFTVTDQFATTTAQTFNINITPANQAPVIQGWTLAASENFETGATGWSSNTTDTSTPYLTQFLGRHSQEAGAQNTFKTFTLSGTQDYTVLNFDFYEIDSWDGETFKVFINDVAVYSGSFIQTSFNTPADGSSGAVSWTIQELTQFNTNMAFSGSFNDQSYRFTMTISNAAAAALKIGFSSTLDQAISDESWGVDNISIYEVKNGGVPGPLQIAENSPNTTIVGKVTARDLDVADTLTYSIIGGTGAGVFSINSSTGVITVTNSSLLDYETTTSYTLNVQVSDNGTPVRSDSEMLTISVINIPENTAPVIPATGPFSVAENSAVNTVVGTVTATDAESNTITYSITAGNGLGIFAINAATGAIRIANNTFLNYETVNTHTLTIRATDNGFGALSSTRNVTINVSNVNEAPSFVPSQAILNLDPTVRYSAATGNFYRYVSTTASLAAARAAAAAAVLNGVSGHLVTVESAAENAFVAGMITASSWMDADDTAVEGEWRFASGPNGGQIFWLGGPAGSAQNGFYSNWAPSQPDNSGNEDGLQMQVGGTWNDAPVGTGYAYVIEWDGATLTAPLQNGPYSVTENTAVGTSIGFAHASDPDTPDTKTFSITGGTGAGLFSINSSTGEILTSGLINYEAATSYTLTLRVQDTAGLFDTTTVTVNVGDVNEAPVLATAGPFNFNENILAGTAVTTMIGSDQDVGQTLTYTIQSGNTGGTFAINSATGALSFANSPDYETANAYNLVIRVTDNGSGALYAERTVAITINDLNEAPVLAAAGPFAFNENIAAGTVVTTMTAIEQDAAQTTTYSIQSGNTGGMFTINAATGVLTFAGSPNFEAVNAYNLVIRATDNGAGNLYTEQTVAIAINNLNETPTLNPAGPFNFNENVSAGTVVTTMTASDPDTGQTLTYSIQSGNGLGTFAINSSTGVITFAASPNYELATSYSLVIRATDNGTGSLFSQQTVNISINNLNEAPSFSPVQAILNSDPTLRYNATTGNFYKYVSATTSLAAAQAAAGAALINGQAGHLVAIDSATENAYVASLISGSVWIDGSDATVEGEWRYVSGPNAGQMFWLGTAAGSAQGGFYTNWNGGEPNNSSNEDGVQMLVGGKWNDINVSGSYGYVIEWEGPTLLAPLQNGPYSIAENTAPGTSIGSAHASDPDSGDTRTFSITGGSGAGLFAINSTTGQITVSGALNYEAASSYTLNLRVQDAGGLFDTTTVTVNILDVNEAPVLNPAGPFTFNENIAAGTLVTTMSATDQDTAQTLTYTIQSGNGLGTFTLNSANGQLRFANSPNYELASSYTLVIRATDNGTGALFSQQTVTVNINNLNEAPSFDPVQAVLNSDPSLRYNATTGNFYKYIAAPASLGGAQSAAGAATLNGQAGHMVDIGSAAENAYIAGLMSSPIWLNGSDSAVEGSWRYVDGPNAGQLFWQGTATGSAQNGFYTNWAGGEPNDFSTGEDAIQMLTGGSWNDISSGGSYGYVIEWEGAPLIAALQNGPYSVTENAAVGTSLGFAHASDPDVGDTKTFSVTGGTGASLFSIDSTTGEIKVAGAINYEAASSYTLNLQVIDNGGLIDTRVVTINVIDLNEVPVLAPAGPFAFNENIAAGTVVTTMSATDQDTAQTLTYTIESGNTGGMFAINAATGQITFTGSPDYETVNAYNLVIRVTDNGAGALYAEQTVAIAINDLNEVPVLNPAGPFNINENVPPGTIVATMVAADQDGGQTLTYTIQSGNTGGMFSIDAATGVLSFAGSPNYENLNIYNLVIRVTDNGTGALYAEQNVDINILDINDIPSDITLSQNHITENSIIDTTIGSLTTTDQDPGDTHTYSIVSDVYNKFKIVGNQLRSKGDIDYELYQNFSIVIRTDDGHGGIYDKNFIIYVDDQADTFTPPPAATPPIAVNRPEPAKDENIRSASLIRSYLQGGEAGQALAFYGLGNFHQILRENMTFEIQEMNRDLLENADYTELDDTTSDSAVDFLSDHKEKPAEASELPDRFTNLREALKFFEDLKDVGEKDLGDQRDVTKPKDPVKVRDHHLPANTINHQFVDVLTYHEQRQARLRAALLGTHT